MDIFKCERSKYGKIIMLIGIPMVGFLLTFVLHNNDFDYFTTEHIFHVFFSILITLVNWLGVMTIVTKLWKKYPWHLQALKHILVEVPIVLGFTIGLMYLTFLLYGLFENRVIEPGEFWQNTAVVIILVLFLTSFHEALFFYEQWKDNFNKSLVLEKANIKAEYDTLKSQINPHFLFNSLNTLITYVDDNELAIKYLYNLSDFLRYTLDNKNTDIKLLRDELNLVRKYLFLQESRFGENLIPNIDIPEKYYHYTIPPLSLQMLVENAIKHNIISKDKALHIKIFIENESYIVVENNLQKRYETNSTQQGLQNIRKRYAFMSKNDVIISEENHKFIVKLPLVITEL
ncbi:MAG: histidine kinase [Bacteroidota bacterium]|nr:histidine kinase [Bacteroidota bacterium]